MEKRNVIGTTPHPNKRGGPPSPLEQHRRDGETSDEQSQRKFVPFYQPENLQTGRKYLLTEIAETVKVSSGPHYLISKESVKEKGSEILVLGFSTAEKRQADVFLISHQVQMGDRHWRRSYCHNGAWTVYWPAGGRTWNWSWVTIEDIPTPA